MEANEIRRRFTDYFVRQGHLAVPSTPLIPPGDPTLLFTSAGMVPFKPYFLGWEGPPQRRLTSVQKCFRTTDIDDVGDDSHLTFFEMLGNFSFGDYFKAEAQAFAWDLVTKEMQIPAERLVTTVFHDDEEAFKAWRKLGVPESKIYRYGEAEGNYWFAGEDGPCGPCSEIHFDYGPSADPPGKHSEPREETGRYLEIWNLVFMQFLQNKDGSKTPLPAKNIDTGAGLERWAMVLQGKRTLYETDLFAPLLAYVAGRCDRRYEAAAPEERRALRVIAEHGRAMTFLIADGVLPSNEGRGYVLRRLIRRALYMAHTLGIQEPILADVAAQVRGQMGEAYRELVDQATLVERVLQQEEERFRRTLDIGFGMLQDAIRLKQAIRADPNRREAAVRSFVGAGRALPFLDLVVSDPSRITGEEAFRLYDTYGFPKELTKEVAAQAGLALDEEGFERAMAEQQERARAAGEFRMQADSAALTQVGGRSTFTGYDATIGFGEVRAIVLNDAAVPEAAQGATVAVVLDRTPFYAEGGGQIGDSGRLLGPRGELLVRDTQTHGDLISHIGEVVQGAIAVGEVVEAMVDKERRQGLRRNHTATHLLHAALRAVLGPQVRQAGSLVAPDRLRFDYTQPEAPTAAQLAQAQRLVAARIRDDFPVGAQDLPYDQAIRSGALAFFGEKYSTDVRVVSICDPDPAVHDCFSKELCGGTHAPRTGVIGAFQIVSEGSIGAGLRRIEALTGPAADAWLAERLQILADLSASLRAPVPEIPIRLRALQDELDGARRRLAAVERQTGAASADALVAQAQDVDGIKVVAGRVDVATADALRDAGDAARKRIGSGVIVLAAVVEGRPAFVAMVTPDWIRAGLHAGKVIKEIAAVTGGGGGGRPEMAQAGGKDVARIAEALTAVPEVVRRLRTG